MNGNNLLLPETSNAFAPFFTHMPSVLLSVEITSDLFLAEDIYKEVVRKERKQAHERTSFKKAAFSLDGPH